MHISKVSKSFNEEVSFLFNDDICQPYQLTDIQKKDIMGDKTVRVRADLHHIIKIETAKNGGNVKEVMEIRLRSKLKSVLIVHYLKILYNRN